MKNRAAFETQLASIMQTLAKAAVTDISKLVEDSSVVLRLEVSRSHKEIDWLRRKLQLVESELRTAQELATRVTRSDGAQIVDQSEAAGGAVRGDADATFVEQLGKNCKAQRCDARPDFGLVVKEEQEEQHAVQILHQTESEHSAGGLNEVDSEYVMFEIDNPLWSSFTQGHSDGTDDPVCANATEQSSQSQSVLSSKQRTNASMVVSGSTLSSLGKDGHVIDRGFVKEEMGQKCLYTEESRSEMGDTQQMDHEQPPLSTNENPTAQVFQPAQQQLDWRIGDTENSTNPVLSSDPSAGIPWRPGKKERGYSCTKCQKTFAGIRDLESHQRVHTGEKPFSCAQCGKRFSLRVSLTTHERVHTGEKPFSCTQCGKRFSLRCNLIRHVRVHTGDKPFSCVYCGRRFAQDTHLRSHYRVHTGEKPYHCTRCGKSFTQSSTLRTHQRMHCKKEILEFRINYM